MKRTYIKIIFPEKLGLSKKIQYSIYQNQLDGSWDIEQNVLEANEK